VLKSGMLSLDDNRTYDRLDPAGMRRRLRDLPRQCEEAWSQANALAMPEHWQSNDKVVIGGMGGSAIAGDLVADLASLQKTVPITVVRDFHFPFSFNHNSLFIGCSHSGNTEETLSLFRQVLQQQARVLAIAGDGALAEESRAQGVPLLTINALGEPRSAVGYNLMLLLGALRRLGVVNTSDDDVRRAIAALRRQIAQLSEEVPTEHNPAKQLARELVGRLIVVYGGGIFSGMARRWKTQFNENAKAWAFFETAPELLHNTVEAYHSSPGINSDKIVLVLEPSSVVAELKSRYQVVTELLHRENIPYRALAGIDGPLLAQLLTMLNLGDYVSYYLALLQGVNPAPTPAIDLGKRLLGDGLTDEGRKMKGE
jgi:glucose/mannose-6-phosphate isomerase